MKEQRSRYSSACKIEKLPLKSVTAGYRHPVHLADPHGWVGVLALCYSPEGTAGYTLRGVCPKDEMKKAALFPNSRSAKAGKSA